MSSSSTEIRTEINCDLYPIDDLFSPATPTTAINYTQQQPSNQKATNCSPLQYNNAGTLPPDNAMSQEWMLDYNTDMNFLFNYNDLDATLNKDQQQQDLKERGAEQFRRFSMMESYQQPTVGYPFQYQQRVIHPSTPTVSSNAHVHYGYQHKERSSMPNVFMSNNNHPAGSQLSWQQTSLLQKRPIHEQQTSNFAIPTSTSSPLGLQQAKKRSMLEQVLHEDYNSPSVVSSLSEPIPTVSTTGQWMISRKRTKSIRSTDHHSSLIAAATVHHMDDTKSNSSSISSSSAIFTSSPTEYTTPIDRHHQQEQFAISTAISDPSFYEQDNQHHMEHNQMLAAMPRRQKLRYDGDHYTPKWVRYTGHLKEGYCDSCHPGKWLQLKNSAYWYHKQFYHGISSVSGKPFMKPLEQRMGKGDMIEGLCHQCRRFVPACNGKKKNNYMLWYRHAHKCHLYDKPKAKSIKKLSNDPTTAI